MLLIIGSGYGKSTVTCGSNEDERGVLGAFRAALCWLCS